MLITVMWSNIKKLRDQMNAPQKVSPFEIFFKKGGRVNHFLMKGIYTYNDISYQYNKHLMILLSKNSLTFIQLNYAHFKFHSSDFYSLMSYSRTIEQLGFSTDLILNFY